MAEGEVNLPFVGNQRKEYVLVGVIFAGGYVAYRYVKARKANAAGATTTAPAAGLVPAGQDASGNEVYYNAAGQLVDANGNPDALATATQGTSVYSNPAPITSTNGTTLSTTAPQTDEQWTSAVESDLESLGYDPQTVAAAVAQYLSSQQLTTAQAQIIRLAWAWEGKPPQHPSLPIVQAGTSSITTSNPGPPYYSGGAIIPIGPVGSGLHPRPGAGITPPA